MDYTLSLTKTNDEHLDVLGKVFTALEGPAVEISNAKCQNFTNRVEYFGHVFYNEGAQPNPKNVRVILEAHCPSNIKVQSFVELYAYYWLAFCALY